MRAAARDAKLIDEKVRDDPRANALFLDVLTDVNSPELVLRWMNEAGVFGRFVPDFGRVVAQMQFDMYHHYTVDEHSIRAIGLLAAIERGELAKDHPLSTALFRQIASRRTLYVAVLLHDIAKGRGGDHSVLGEQIALKLGPRFGLDPAETETVVWLVRHHLLMSSTAFKRDLADPKTIEDFVRQVQSPERLRLLLILTVVDIRAVGPGVWNEWKRVLLRTLFDAAEERLRLGHKQRGRSELIAARQQELAKALGWKAGASRALMRSGCPTATGWPSRSNGSSPTRARWRRPKRISARRVPSVVAEDDPDSGATRISVFTPDREGLFYRICAGLAAAGANIIDARIHTTRDGMALDNLLVQDGQGRAYADRRLRNRLVRSVESGADQRRTAAAARGASERPRATAAFRIAPSVVIAERASSRTTVVEVNARDRPALLAALARAIHDCGPPHPFGAHRDLWRARGRRLLSDPGGRQEARRRARSTGCARRCSTRPRQAARRRPPEPKEKGPAVSGEALPIERCSDQPRSGCGGGGGGGGGGTGQASVARITDPSGQVCVAGGGGGGGGGAT